MAGFRWTGRREEAAMMVAEGRLSESEIGRRVGVVRQTLRAWKRDPEFRSRVETLVEAIADRVREEGIANRQRRIQALNDRWLRLLRLIETRSVEMGDVPGGETGLLTRQTKLVKVFLSTGTGGKGMKGTGRAVEVADFPLDVGLLRELRELEKQAAMETGEWAKGAPDEREGMLNRVLDEIWEEMGEEMRNEITQEAEQKEAERMQRKTPSGLLGPGR